MTDDPGDVPRAELAVLAVDRAVHEFRRGRVVLVAEGEGPGVLAVAAEMVSENAIALLTRLGGAQPDLAITHHRARTLKVPLYTDEVVLVPFPSWLTAEGARSVADPATDLRNPLRGPFRARRDPVVRAALAAVRLAKNSRLLPAALLVQVPPGFVPPAETGILSVDAQSVLDFELETAGSLHPVISARVPLAGAENTRIHSFRSPEGGREHLAIVIGDPLSDRPVLVRLHSECFTGDLIGSLKCDCGEQLRGAIDQIAGEGSGVLLYLRQEGRGIGLTNKLRAYALQDQGFDTVEANQRLGFESDERLFLPAARILRQLGFTAVRLLTNNPDKVAALEQYGIRVVERVPHSFPSNDHNAFYLSVKRDKSGHLI